MTILTDFVAQITLQDLGLVGLLIFLEGILSIDNALVLAMMARELPKHQQKRALTYGFAGAVVFRLLALSIVTYLIAWNWVKFVGGAYLLYLAVRHFFSKPHDPTAKGRPAASFWGTVAKIELMDIAFAIDSILAAVALTPKFWIVFTGGILGVFLMRVAASGFIRVLERFPGFETTAYLLVAVIGIKVILEGIHLEGVDFHSSGSPAFWVFWGVMAACIASGFIRRSPKP
jgi:YkoY family integral membrane protein